MDEPTPWEEMMRQAEQEEVLVMRDGHAVALLMPFDDDDLEWYAREAILRFWHPCRSAATSRTGENPQPRRSEKNAGNRLTRGTTPLLYYRPEYSSLTMYTGERLM